MKRPIVLILFFALLLTACFTPVRQDPYYLITYNYQNEIYMLKSTDKIVVNLNDDLFDMRCLTFLGDFSDDGRYLAFSLDSIPMIDSSYTILHKSDLFIYDVKNNNCSQISCNEHVDSRPRFSPNGDMIVFMRQEEWGGSKINWNVMLTDKNGEQVRDLVVADRQELFPLFSDNGQYIFYRVDQNDRIDIYRNTLDGLNEIRVTNDSFEEQYFDVSINGDRLYFSSFYDGIFVKDISTGERRRLTADSLDCKDPKLSPNDSLIAYIWLKDQYPTLCLAQIDGSGERRIGWVYDYEFSPDGLFLFYSNYRGIYSYEIETEIKDTLLSAPIYSCDIEVTKVDGD